MKKYEKGTVEYEIQRAMLTGIKPCLLLHACCGPCLAGTLANIAEHFDITVYFYNPNIMPNEEFNKRLQALKDVILHFDNIKLIIPEQCESDYLPLVNGLENAPEGGERCKVCFDMRLNKTAEYFADNRSDFDFFTTTLTISPLKNAELINAIGQKAAELCGVKYLNSNFKKNDGYLKSTTLCRKWEIYRQHYCGCKFKTEE